MKNKFILGAILGIFLIGLVSASITGYLVRGGGAVATEGYTATLQKVEGTTAIVSVQTPTGDTKLVRVAEGETAKVGEAEISAFDLTKGTLFRRGGANVEINVVKEKGAGVVRGCEDTDGGLNIYKQGSGEDSFGETGTDSCTDDGKQVIEIACNEEGYLYSQEIDCPKGCLNGACIKPEETCKSTPSCRYFRAEDFETGLPMGVVEACLKGSTDYRPIAVIEGQFESLYSGKVCDKNSLMTTSSSDIWYSVDYDDENPNLTSTILSSSCGPASGSTANFSNIHRSQVYKGVLCCSEVCLKPGS